MKGITGNSALEAYRRVALAPVNPAQPSPGQAASVSGERPPAEAAKVSISTEARELAAKGEAQVSSKKVESLRASISDGSFKVNSHLVAQRLLNSQG
jgi:flagellar biosynthesis anti-sigma factor FlgM